MGNREALLVGAKRCLFEKGYARTSARDIAAASAVSLAAIGYHYGSKEALLNVAIVEATKEWGDELGRVLASADVSEEGSIERFEAIWDQVIKSFATHRSLWAASFESSAEIDRVPAVREILADAIEEARMGLPSLFRDDDDDGAEAERVTRAVGSFYQALMTGVLAQWLTDPERAPSASDLALALRTIAVDVGQSGSGEHG